MHYVSLRLKYLFLSQLKQLLEDSPLQDKLCNYNIK